MNGGGKKSENKHKDTSRVMATNLLGEKAKAKRLKGKGGATRFFWRKGG